MHWSRVKTILIIMFLCVDILLFSASFILHDGSGKINSDTISDTVQVLKDSKIFIDEKIISNKIPTLGTIETENLRADRNGFARLLLNDEAAVYKNGTYKSGEKLVTFENTYVTAKNLIKNIEPFTADNIKNELEIIGIRAKKVIAETDSAIVLLQEFDGKPVFETEITVTKDNTITGYFFAAKQANSYSKNEESRLMPVCSVLINLIDIPEAFGETISTIETGYTLGEPDGNDSYTLISVFPAYRIKTQTGKIFMFDATSGDLLYRK